MIPQATTSIFLLCSTLRSELPVDCAGAGKEVIEGDLFAGDATGRSQLVVFVLWLT